MEEALEPFRVGVKRANLEKMFVIVVRGDRVHVAVIVEGRSGKVLKVIRGGRVHLSGKVLVQRVHEEVVFV
jgi:hypothetical protein